MMMIAYTALRAHLLIFLEIVYSGGEVAELAKGEILMHVSKCLQFTSIYDTPVAHKENNSECVQYITKSN